MSDASQRDDTATAAAGGYRWLLLAGVWLLYFGFGLTVAAMAPLVGPIKRDLGLSDAAMGSVLGAWPLVYIAAAIPCGALLDRVGPRRALFAAAVIMAASGALRGFATGHLSLFLAVALFGLGGPLISIGAPKLVAHWFEGRDRGLAMGIYITGPALGGIIALSATNAVLMPLAGDDWRLVLAWYAGFVLLCGIAWLAIQRHPQARAVERAITQQPARSQGPVFLALLRLPSVRLVLAMSVLIFFYNHGMNNWLPEILRRGGLSAAAAGTWAALPTVVGIGGALLIPRLALPHRRVAILLALIAAAALAPLLLVQADGQPAPLAAGLVLQGIARSSLMTLAMLVLLETDEVGAANAGAAGGLFFAAAEIGGVLGPLSLGALSDLTGGFDAGLYLLTGLCGLLALLLWRLTRAGLRPAPSNRR